jgi:hypothetical protein
LFTIPSGLKTHIQQDVTTLAYAYKVTYNDPILGNQIIGITTTDQDVVLAGVTYRAGLGVNPSSISSEVNTIPASTEVDGFFSIDGVLEADILAGKWDNASVEIMIYNWASPADGVVTLFKGRIASVRIEGRKYLFELTDLIDLLSLNVGELTSPACRADLFDAKCKVKSNPPTWASSTAYTLNPAYDANAGSVVKPSSQSRRWFRCTTAGTSGGSEPSWNLTVGATTADGSAVWTAINAFVLSGSVTTATSNQVFSDSSITEATGFWAHGKIVWTSGLNQGRAMEIKTQSSTVISLYLPMVNAIGIGDTFAIYAGCDKLVNTCKTKFGNTYNFRGEPHKPRTGLLYAYATR